MPDQKNDSPEIKSVQREREKLLKKAQRLVYPLGHTRNKIALISASVFLAFVVIFITISSILVYVSKSESEFTYQVNKILPFPVGNLDGNIVTYDEYLFELRPALHFLEQFGDLDPESNEYKDKADGFRKEAEQRIYINALAENLAIENNITVSDAEVDNVVANLKAQAGLESIDQLTIGTDATTGPDNPRFEEILAQYHNWTINDLRRALNIQLIKSKLPSKIDTETRDLASTVASEAQDKPKKNFGKLAKEYSVDKNTAKEEGEIGELTEDTSIAYPKEFVQAANELKDGEVSDVVESYQGLHIIYRQDTSKDGLPVVSQILLQFEDPEVLLKDLLADSKEVDKYLEIN